MDTAMLALTERMVNQIRVLEHSNDQNYDHTRSLHHCGAEEMTT